MKKTPLSSIFNISIFTPTSKVHVQRDVMREADNRLTNYSRRGILLNLAIFTLAIFAGEYYSQQPIMTLILATGLVFITLIRAYFLFRFDQVYAKGPNRWRQLYFYSSLMGSSWWGFIVANITWVNGFHHETPILWLYTVAFFAGSIYIFAPFQRFLVIYMFTSFMPCALVAIYLFEAMSILYGSIMISLYLLLCRQGKNIGQNYWDKLQATYDLLKRANTLEAEKINTESSLNNRDIIYNNLTRELKSSMQEILGSVKLLKYSQLNEEDEQLVTLTEQKTQQQINLLKNVAELTNLNNKNLNLDQHIFDLRYHIEQALSHVSLVAHKKNIELYTSFSSEFPLRARGDAERIEQMIENLVSSACQFCQSGELTISSKFSIEEEPGILKVSILNKKPTNEKEDIDNINAAFSPQHTTDINLGLSLAIVKGLAECMDGDAGADYTEDGNLIFWLTAKLSSASSGATKVQPSLKLSGKRVMLYQPPKAIANTFHSTLESWGLNVDIVNEEAKAISLLEQENEKKPYQLVIIYTRLTHVEGLSLSKKIAEHPTLWSVPQIAILSKLQNKLECVEEHFLKYVNIATVYKPVQQRHLQKAIKSFLVKNGSQKGLTSSQEKDFLTGKQILLFQQEEIDVAIIKAMLKKLHCKVIVAATLDDSLEILSNTPIDAFICEGHLDNVDLKRFVEQAREANDPLHKDHYKIPILGLSSRELDDEETQCLATGMEYYIDSPTNIDDLRAILRRFIGRSVYMSENT